VRGTAIQSELDYIAAGSVGLVAILDFQFTEVEHATAPTAFKGAPVAKHAAGCPRAQSSSVF